MFVTIEELLHEIQKLRENSLISVVYHFGTEWTYEIIGVEPTINTY